MDNINIAASMRKKNPEVKKMQFRKIVERVEKYEENINNQEMLKNLEANNKPSKKN